MTPENGAPASPLVEEPPDCPICLDRQWVHPQVDGKPDYSDIRRCVCQKKNDENRKRLALLLGCKLPRDADRFTFDTFKVFPDLQEAYDACVAFASGKSDVEWLTLLAGVDKGKSHLAIAICHTFIKRGIPARYLFVPSGLDALRAGYDAEGEQGYEAQLRHMINVDLLVLDDLGAQVPTPWAMEKLMMIIDERYMAGLPLVTTTNKALNMLPGDDEGRIGSRIMRHPHALVITIKAPEFRMRSKR